MQGMLMELKKSRPREVILVLLTLAFDLFAFARSVGAGFVAFSVSVLALGHYASLYFLVRQVGRGAALLLLSAFILTLLTLFFLLFIVGFKLPSLFPWGAAAACIGPFFFTVTAAVEGLLLLKRRAA